MSEELKPCPFCGSTHVEYDNDAGNDGGFWEWIGCNDCGTKVPGYGNVNPRDAWNRRATPAPAQPEPSPVAWRVGVAGEWQMFSTRREAERERAEYEADCADDPDTEHQEPEPLFTHPAAASTPAVPEPSPGAEGGVLGYLAYQGGDDPKPRFYPSMEVAKAGVARWQPPVSQIVPVVAAGAAAPVEGAQEQVQEAVGRFAIEVEKMLCEKLGVAWSAAGISIVSLIDRLAAASKEKP